MNYFRITDDQADAFERDGYNFVPGLLGHFGDHTGADPERVRHALKHPDPVYCEMEPGTALFFHSNLLHTSDANESINPRWALICCYNAARNDPYKESGHPRYTPLEKVADEAIIQAGKN